MYCGRSSGEAGEDGGELNFNKSIFYKNCMKGQQESVLLSVGHFFSMLVTLFDTIEIPACLSQRVRKGIRQGEKYICTIKEKRFCLYQDCKRCHGIGFRVILFGGGDLSVAYDHE